MKRNSSARAVRKLAEDSKKYFKNSLGEFVYYRSYSRWIDAEQRRETWIETVDRYIGFHERKSRKEIKRNRVQRSSKKQF